MRKPLAHAHGSVWAFLVIPAVAIAAALAYQTIGLARDRRRYPAPGRLISIGNTRLHLNEQGQGSPAVVFESGIGASSLSWADVQPRVAQFARTVSYDRAGLGWSDAAQCPRSVPAMVEEVRALLSEAGVPSPYVLVGHSFGGLLVDAFASLYPRDVAGLVLVDPVSTTAWANCPEQERKRLELGARLARRGGFVARLGIVRAALNALVAGGRGFPGVAARIGGRQGTDFLAHLVGEVRKLPASLWPMVRAHWSDPKCFHALADYLECLPESAAYTVKLPRNREIPIAILSAATATAEEVKERDERIAGNAQGEHVRVDNATHWVQFDRPEAVVAAIRFVQKGIPSAHRR